MLTQEEINAFKPQCILNLNEQLPGILMDYFGQRLYWSSPPMSLAEHITDWNFEDPMYGHYGQRNSDDGLWHATKDWLNNWAERIEEMVDSEVMQTQMKQALTFIVMTQVEVEEEEMQQC